MSAERAHARRPAIRPRLAATLACLLGLAVVGCSGSGQSGSAFVFLTVEGFSLDGTTFIGSVDSSLSQRTRTTQACVTMRNNLKNPTVTTPTGLDSVLIQSYTVKIVRLDGGASPDPFTIGTSVTVPAGTVPEDSSTVSGNTATFGIVLVPAQLKVEPPLSGAAGPLSATAEVTFRGRDGRGERVEAQGAVGLTFLSGSEAASVTCAGSSAGDGGDEDDTTTTERRRRPGRK